MTSLATWSGIQLLKALDLGATGREFINFAKIISTGSLTMAGAMGTALPIILAITAAIITFAAIWKEFEDIQYEASYENQSHILEDMVQSYQSMQAEADALKAKGDALTQTEQNRLSYLEQQLQVMEEQSVIAEQEQKTWEAWNKEFQGKVTATEGSLLPSLFTPYTDVAFLQSYNQGYANVISYARDFEQLASAMQSGTQSTDELTSAFGEYIGKYKELYEQTVKYKEAGRELNSLQENLIVLYDIATDTYADLIDVQQQSADGIESESEAFSTLQQKIQGATTALEAFNAAASVDYEAPLKGYQDAYTQFLEDYEAGKMGAGSIRAAIDLFIPEDKKAELGYDVQEMADYLASNFSDNFAKGILTAEDPITKFGDTLNENLPLMGDMVKVLEDGSYMISSYEDLANYFKTTPEFIQAMFYAIQEYNSQLIVTEEEYRTLADKIEGISDLSLEDLISEIQALTGETDPDRIAQYINAFKELGYIDTSATVEEIRGVQTELQEAAKEADEASQPRTMSLFVLGTDELQTMIDKVAELATMLNHPFQLIVDVVGGAVGGIKGLVSNLLKPAQHAKGTRNSAGGLAIVNDGSPVNGSSKELIIDNGQAYIANGEPALVNLSKGAQVYTAAETQDILGGVPAFGNGVKSPISVGITIPSSKKGSKHPDISNWDYSGSGASTTPNVPLLSKEEFDKLLKEKKHALAMDEITEREYYDWLADANERYLAGREEYLDEYWRHQEEVYNYEKQALEDEISLEEKLNELAKAKTQKVLVYKDGMFQYVSNTEAIAKAQREVAAYGGGKYLDSAGIVGGLGGMNGVNVGGSGETNITNINVEEVTLEKADNVEELFEGLSNLAIQRTTSRG